MIRLTRVMPATSDRSTEKVYVNPKYIEFVSHSPKGKAGAYITLNGSEGGLHVLESVQEVVKLIEEAK